MMAEKPILFSGEMVRAILAGRKTQTRRVIKPQPAGSICHGVCTSSTNKKHIGKIAFGEECLIKSYAKPRYQPGDILWVRETFGRQWRHGFVYRADKKAPIPADGWKPSIHMPRKAARLFLKVTNVRCEELQDITGDDAIKEGMQLFVPADFQPNEFYEQLPCMEFERATYIGLWERLNVKRGYGWETNPLVWVIEFERVGK